MRTTINIDAELLAKARRSTGIKRKTDLVAAGLRSLVEREGLRRLAAMGGTMPDLEAAPRRRFQRKRP